MGQILFIFLFFYFLFFYLVSECLNKEERRKADASGRLFKMKRRES